MCPTTRLRPFDWFALANLILLAAIGLTAYRARLAQLRGGDDPLEFAAYAALTAVAFALGWRFARRVPARGALLALVEFGLLLHFAGGLVHVHGLRLYDLRLCDCPALDLRYDKLVHLANAAVWASVVTAVLRSGRHRLGRLEPLVVVLVVLGLGSVWEIVEYVAVKTLPNAGVGGYDNNMQDLAANLCGALASRLIPATWRRGLESPAEDGAPGPNGRA